MSVKSRILQFQQNSPHQPPALQASQSTVVNGGHNNKVANNSVNKDSIRIANCINKNNNSSTSHFTQNNFTNSNNLGNVNSNISNCNSTIRSQSPQYQHPHQAQQYNHNNKNTTEPTRQSRKSEISNLNKVSLNSTLSLSNNINHNVRKISATSGIIMSNPPVNRATKPILMTKKASMTINLSSNVESTTTTTAASPGTNTDANIINNGTVQLRPKFGRSPSNSMSRTLPSPTSSSAIPKPGFGFGSTLTNGVTNGASLNTIVGRKSPGKITPATTPTKSYLPDFGSASISSSVSSNYNNSNNGTTGKLYGGIGWKEKFEESEKKRNHLVNLAQKATRDYEELRRRYHEIHAENDKLSRKLDGQTGQLDSLRKASEAVYQDYYKLKKRYESENREKSDALTRVDQYNKENRRLKRQSAALMMQINDPTSLASAFDAVCETDSAENDKEILYLRSRVQELESKVVELDSELEKTRLAEFETQESVMLMNDSINSIKSENIKLKEQLKQLDEENRKAISSLEDVTFEYDTLKVNSSFTEEKLILVETELKKIQNEKNILQRQSLVFMNDAMDNRLIDALNQIGDLQTALEEQKNAYEAQQIMLQHQLSETESTEESLQIQTSAKIRSLEEEVISLRQRAEESEQKLEEFSFSVEPKVGPPPPPPPMPGLSMNGPPPLPPPMIPLSSLNDSLKSGMVTLRKAKNHNASSNNGFGSENDEGGPKSIVTQSPQIDDMISQLKKGIKLKPTDRTLSRKPTEVPQEKEDIAVEEMRSILNNLRRTRRSP